MGIILSLLFPNRFMFTEQPAASSASSSAASNTDQDPLDPDISPFHSPLAEFSSLLEHERSISHPYPNNADPRSQPSLAEARPYTPHAVGLGLFHTARVTLSPPSPLVGEPAASMQPGTQIEQSSHPGHLDLPESMSLQVSANSPRSPTHRAGCYSSEPDGFPPTSPSLVSAEASAANAMHTPPSTHEADSSAPSSSPSSPALRVTIPAPQHHPGNPFVHSGPALSPPPLASSASSPHQTESGLQAPAQGSHSSLDLGEEIPLGPASIHETALNLDLAEFDFEGLSTLEKIYCFSRSRAGFQRVFIAHALPGFLRSGFRQQGDTSDTHPDDRSEMTADADEITPAEAVEYVLPLLNGLAMDEDEAVKEALAAELVPIIWWFITHCQLVEDDPVPAFDTETGEASHEPTQVSVQAFTPILGTLLLSPNGLIGGPARYAVVELLSRVRRADAKDQIGGGPLHRLLLSEHSDGHVLSREEDRGGTILAKTTAPSTADENAYSPVGLFGSFERRLFEREMVHQVVIGMSRLDLLEEGAMEGPEEEGLQIPDTTAMPTPHAHVLLNQARESDSYFPPMDSIPDVAEPDSSTLVSPEILSTESDASQIVSTLLSAEDCSPSSVESTPPLTTGSSSESSTPASSMYSHTPSPTETAVPGDKPILQSTSPIRSTVQFVQDWVSTPTSQPVSPRSISPSITTASPSASQPVSPRLSLLALSNPRSPSPGSHSPRPPSPRPASPIATSSLRRSPIPIGASSLEPISTERVGSPTPEIVSPIPDHAPGVLHAAFDDSITDNEPFSGPPGEDEGDVVDVTQMNEEASVGRLSSMSLMAAVTASGPIDEDTKAAFVTEVERVGRDPVYWVRREASFAVGALAKVVSQEVVRVSLLPLFEALYRDPTWHVRHSALFALPAILTRLPPQERRSLALDVVLTLAQDDSMTVRSGVLEALAEVIYTFHEDDERPPERLLRLFLGVREDDDPRKPEVEDVPQPSSPASSLSWSDFVASVSSGTSDGPEPDIYDDTSRPLVCAFNLPAVALTLGRERWSELRELYQQLSHTRSFKVRRTLAASLGELARIIGPEQARADLMPVWWASVRSDEADIRLKALESVETFVAALGAEERAEVLNGIEERVWPLLRGWRERETAVKAIPNFAVIDGVDEHVVWRLLMKGLTDSAATVREAAVSTLPAIIAAWASRIAFVQECWKDIVALAHSTSYRQRIIFLACHQALFQSAEGFGAFATEAFVQTLSTLAQDPIIDVRISVARLLGSFNGQSFGSSADSSQALLDLAIRLSQDSSPDVKAFAQPLVENWPPVQPRRMEMSEIARTAANFSRPPPLAPR